MTLKKCYSYIVIVLAFMLLTPCYATIIVPISLVDSHGQGAEIGTIRLDDTVYGLLLTPDLHDIPAGFHGFHIHSCPSCDNFAMAAGGHFDPEHTYEHRGPYRGSGHLGDLPVLLVNMRGRATLPVLAPRLKIAQITGRSIVVLAGGDNYSEEPPKKYTTNIRIACGVIPYH
jgi:Cu-Zn family superoxide dismutase